MSPLERICELGNVPAVDVTREIEDRLFFGWLKSFYAKREGLSRRKERRTSGQSGAEDGRSRRQEQKDIFHNHLAFFIFHKAVLVVSMS